MAWSCIIWIFAKMAMAMFAMAFSYAQIEYCLKFIDLLIFFGNLWAFRLINYLHI
jgi:hypothetical protein